MTWPRRNEPCPCGSGLRFKACHGSAAAPALPPETTRHRDAYLAAEACRKRGDLVGAKSNILEALEQTGWKAALYRGFLAAILGDEATLPGSPVVAEPGARFLARAQARQTPASSDTPLVTVALACHRHAPYVEAALRSVFRQSYRRIELVVIDDGSDDGSAGVIGRCLAESPFEHRFIARQRRGAAETVNEAMKLANGAFVCLLNSDDCMHEERLRHMVAAIAGTGSQWGFSSVQCIDAQGSGIDPLHDRYVYDLYCAAADAAARPTIGFALMTQNIAASSGNLFASRDMLRDLGGFQAYRHVAGWDYCLRALPLAEPVFVRQAVYYKRLHRGNQPAAALAAMHTEAAAVCGRYLHWACTAKESLSPVAPCAANWPLEFRKAILETGLADLIDVPTLRILALGRS